MPIAKRDLTKVAAAGDSRRATLLLAAIDPIWKAIVGNNVITLRRRLVVPGAPSSPAIHADGRALVARQGDDLRIFGIEPDGVIVVAARSALDGGERGASIRGTISRCVDDVD